MLPSPTANKLLSGLPLEDRQRISSYLTTVPAPFKHVFYKQDGPTIRLTPFRSSRPRRATHCTPLSSGVADGSS